MDQLATQYGLPAEIMKYVETGFLEVLSEEPEEGRVMFHVPSRICVNRKGRITAFKVEWVEPGRHAETCREYGEDPAEIPNFDAIVDTTDLGSDNEGLQTLDDLECWLVELQEWGEEGLIRAEFV